MTEPTTAIIPTPHVTMETSEAASSVKDSLSVKLPPFLRAALDREAARWGQSTPEFVRSLFIFAMRQPEGVVIRLTGELDQPELPLRL